MSLPAILARIGRARSQHTEAETDIFENAALGKPISASVPALQDLIQADKDLAEALTELLAALG